MLVYVHIRCTLQVLLPLSWCLAIESFWVECHCPVIAKFLGREYNTVIETGPNNNNNNNNNKLYSRLKLQFYLSNLHTYTHILVDKLVLECNTVIMGGPALYAAGGSVLLEIGEKGQRVLCSCERRSSYS